MGWSVNPESVADAACSQQPGARGRNTAWSPELDGAVNIWWAAACRRQLHGHPRSEDSAVSLSYTQGQTHTSKHTRKHGDKQKDERVHRQIHGLIGHVHKHWQSHLLLSLCRSVLLYLWGPVWTEYFPCIFFFPKMCLSTYQKSPFNFA